MSLTQLAKEFGISRARIGQILNAPIWNARRRKSTDARGWVYFVRSGEHIKIGVTNDWERRLLALRAGSPLLIELLALVRGGREFEAECHQRFAHYRSHYEWFHVCDEILQFAAQLSQPQDVPPVKNLTAIGSVKTF